MTHLFDPCLRAAREWLPVPGLKIRTLEHEVELDVDVTHARGSSAAITLGTTTVTVSAERGRPGDPQHPYQAFMRVSSLPWEVRPGTTRSAGDAGSFRLGVERASKAEVGARVLQAADRSEGESGASGVDPIKVP